MIEQIQKRNWDERVIQADTPVLVKFGAEWCGPCKNLDPILEQVNNRSDITVVTVDIEEEDNLSLVAQFGIRGIPTMVLLDKGEVVHQMIGLSSKAELDLVLDTKL